MKRPLSRPLVALAVVSGTLLLVSGCGGKGNETTAEPRTAFQTEQLAPPTRTAPAHHGSLAVTLTAAKDARVGSPVGIDLRASAAKARGALGYRIRFGDGRKAANVLPQICAAEGGGIAHEHWTLYHSYRKPGRYELHAEVYVNCGGDHTTTMLPIVVR